MATSAWQFIGGPFFGPPPRPRTPFFDEHARRTRGAKRLPASPSSDALQRARDLASEWYTKGDAPPPELPGFLGLGKGMRRVAVHVRRGDADAQRYSRHEEIERCIQHVASAERVRRVTLVTEGNATEAAAWMAKLQRRVAPVELRLHLNGDAQTAFHHLVRADILIGADSSFSFAAAFVSKGLYLMPRRRVRTEPAARSPQLRALTRLRVDDEPHNRSAWKMADGGLGWGVRRCGPMGRYTFCVRLPATYC